MPFKKLDDAQMKMFDVNDWPCECGENLKREDTPPLGYYRGPNTPRGVNATQDIYISFCGNPECDDEFYISIPYKEWS